MTRWSEALHGRQRRTSDFERQALTGTSVAAMAKQMKRSTAAVRNHAARLKIVVAKSRKQGQG